MIHVFFSSFMRCLLGFFGLSGAVVCVDGCIAFFREGRITIGPPAA